MHKGALQQDYVDAIQKALLFRWTSESSCLAGIGNGESTTDELDVLP